MTKECCVCGAVFEARRSYAKYCSHKCANHSRYGRTYEQYRQEYKELEKKLWVLYKKGLKDKEIAERIGVSTTWVQRRRIKMGLPKQITKTQREKARAIENAQIEFRFCKKCGSVFNPIRVNQVYCSKACEKTTNHSRNDIKEKRIRKYLTEADNISLWDVFKRDDGICYLCGEACDPNDYTWIRGHKTVHGNYPSRDHIRPISKGGTHSWDNVRLAHIRCNSSKGTKYGEEELHL